MSLKQECKGKEQVSNKYKFKSLLIYAFIWRITPTHHITCVCLLCLILVTGNHVINCSIQIIVVTRHVTCVVYHQYSEWVCLGKTAFTHESLNVCNCKKSIIRCSRKIWKRYNYYTTLLLSAHRYEVQKLLSDIQRHYHKRRVQISDERVAPPADCSAQHDVRILCDKRRIGTIIYMKL